MGRGPLGPQKGQCEVRKHSKGETLCWCWRLQVQQFLHLHHQSICCAVTTVTVTVTITKPEVRNNRCFRCLFWFCSSNLRINDQFEMLSFHRG